MSNHPPFEPHPRDLPSVLPIFPLSGALLLPRGQLPLNIFEPRYLNMTADVFGTAARLIGMIQPVDATAPEAAAPIFSVGCAGRISAFNETEDGRVLITLSGLCRFRVVEELADQRGYRRVAADWRPFAVDFIEEAAAGFDRSRLLVSLKAYFKLHGIVANWDAIEKSPDERLITSLAMICPFEPNEKQALLEAETLSDRGRLLVTLLEMAVLGQAGGADAPRH